MHSRLEFSALHHEGLVRFQGQSLQGGCHCWPKITQSSLTKSLHQREVWPPQLPLPLWQRGTARTVLQPRGTITPRQPSGPCWQTCPALQMRVQQCSRSGEALPCHSTAPSLYPFSHHQPLVSSLRDSSCLPRIVGLTHTQPLDHWQPSVLFKGHSYPAAMQFSCKAACKFPSKPCKKAETSFELLCRTGPHDHLRCL